MNKKLFTVILVVLLAMTCAFAYKGEIKIGLSAGAGSNNVSYDDSTNRLTGILLGGNLTASVHYGISDDSYVKLEAGVNTYNTGAIYVNGEKYKDYDEERDPNAVFYLGYVYNMTIGSSGMFEWEIGAGLQGIAGSNFKGNDFNLALGLGFEETFIFNITNNLALTSTTRAGIQFVNTNKDFADWLKSVNSLSIPVYFTAGVTYSL